MGLGTLVTLILAVAKLMDKIDISWIWVFIPVLSPIIIMCVLAVGGLIVTGVVGLVALLNK